MKNKLLILLLVFILFPVSIFGQVKITSYLSAGYINHLTRNGINAELGFDVEFLKRIDLSMNLRYSTADKNNENEVTVQAISSYLSFVIINRETHRLMLGPGISYGKYKRYSELFGFEKEYNSDWFNFLKIRYDYSISPNLIIGLDLSLYGDDGDASYYSGVLLGYKFK